MIKFKMSFAGVAAIAFMSVMGAHADGHAHDNSALEGVPSGAYTLDPTHAYLTAKVGHSSGISSYLVQFTDFSVDLSLDTETLENSAVSVSIDPSKIFVNYPGDYKASHADSGYETWTEDLSRSENWLNSDNFPEITFSSTSVTRTGDNSGEVTGDVTFLGVTKPVTLTVTFGGAIDNPWTGAKLVGFAAETEFNRSEFGSDTYIPMIGDAITLEFNGELGHVSEE